MKTGEHCGYWSGSRQTTDGIPKLGTREKIIKGLFIYKDERWVQGS